MGLFLLGEGFGEVEALPKLVGRLRAHLGLESLPYTDERRMVRRVSILTQDRVRETCEQLRRLQTCSALLLTRDADNKHLADADCPKHTAPRIAKWVRELTLPFPVAVVLFYQEYETLFVASVDGMAGKAVKDAHGRVIFTVPEDVASHPQPEYERDAKGWLRRHGFSGYGPARHQKILTQALELDSPALSALSSYRRLISALRFLEANLGAAGAVYPPSQEGAAENA